MEVPSKRTLRHSSHTDSTSHDVDYTSKFADDGFDDVSVSSTLVNEQLHQEAQISRTRNETDQYTTVGQLAFAPATQTTVVTTTTTTTTSFPPMLMRRPDSFQHNDPKLFPLANAPTPPKLVKFSLMVNGCQAHFTESQDVDGTLRKYNQKQSQLQHSNGVLSHVLNSQMSYDTPDRVLAKHSSHHLSGYAAAASPIQPSRMRRDMSPSAPPSIAEAAEIASLQRRNKRPFRPQSRVSTRTPAHIVSSGPETPETDTGAFMAPPTGGRHRRPSLRSSKTVSASSLDGDARVNVRPSQSKLHLSSTTAANSSYDSRSAVASVAATPPIVEGDLERLDSFELEDRSQSQRLGNQLRLLETRSTMDASLPSPSLSPITAAAQYGNPLGIHDGDDEDNEVSSLDISQDALEGGTHESRTRRRRSNLPKELDTPLSMVAGSPDSPLGSPTLMDVSQMLESFDSLPYEMQQYLMFHLLRRCDKPTLHLVADIVNPALKCDFLTLLPLELSLNVTKYLDAKSMCNAAQVSHKWREIVDSDEATWKDLLDRDGYKLPKGELERAIREGWGWQFPYGLDEGEEDLSPLVNVSALRVDHVASLDQLEQDVLGASSAASSGGDVSASLSVSGRPKRKATGKSIRPGKRLRKMGPPAKQLSAPFLLYPRVTGPNAHAAQARIAVPEPKLGVPSLRKMHLYKSLYRRHHLIHKSWMNENIKPHHIAFRAHQRHVVTCLQFDTDKILTGSDDTKINVYDTKTGAKRKTLEGHEGGVWALEYEGNTLVSGSTDRSVRVWNIETGKCMQVFQGHTSTVRCLVILKPTQVGTEADGTPIMMPKQPLIITGSRDSSLRVWKLPNVNDAALYQAGPSASDFDNPYFVRVLAGHHQSVRAIAAHGDTLVSGSYDCTVRVWKISTGEMVHRLAGHTQKVYSVVLDHERNRCISGSMDNMVKVWSLEGGHCVFNLEGHTSLVGLLDLSHERLVSAAADSTLRIWDPQNGQCKSTLTAHTAAITCFQHDNQKVISGSDKTLKMWDIKTGECVKDLITDLSGVWQVRFNERRCVAAVQRDNLTFIEVLDFGASRDGVPKEKRGHRIVVDKQGHEVPVVVPAIEAANEEVATERRE